jgi:wyosine [tRNA(Phe)-imidazoG37] synthetase (radical SAM superfamily)
MSAPDNSVIAFGPVPSRRLGQSLGINNIPPKSCSYSCVYCQVGITRQQEIERREFYPPQHIFEAVRTRLNALRSKQQQVDYLTFVPDGEPTLDLNLPETIALLKTLALPIAVISNASLLWQKAVRDSLRAADFVSIKIDSTDELIWRRINRPHPDLRLAQIFEGIRQFAKDYQGVLCTETMLVKGLNDTADDALATAALIDQLQPAVAYLAIPTRPPAVEGTSPASEAAVIRAYEVFGDRGLKTELLITERTGEFGFTGNLQVDILNTAAVHPLTEQAIHSLLAKAGASAMMLDELLKDGRLRQVAYEGRVYYVRNWSASTASEA